MKPGRTVEMTGAWKTRKTKPRFPLRFPPPLEIAARFPHSHRPGGWLCSKTLKIKTQERRPCWRIASLPPLGSFFNEKMLWLWAIRLDRNYGPPASPGGGSLGIETEVLDALEIRT